ncbi:DUF1254 domain-containing protein [Candidatus Dependentiae bacterium]|nr:DUF1254 domain-containing protein [Candidatus Dependentiae bacterium]
MITPVFISSYVPQISKVWDALRSLPQISLIVLYLLTFIAQPLSAAINIKEAEALGIEVYIYGYPLVTMEMTKRVMTNTTKPKGNKAPLGQFAHARTYPTAAFKDVTAPNADTLYSSAWLDLTKEPYILQVPDQKGRYFVLPFLSGWTNVFSSIGTRTTGTGKQTYALLGPEWKGTYPARTIPLKAPTNLVWIIGRTYCSGTPQDYKAVHRIQDNYLLTPLSIYESSCKPPVGSYNPEIDSRTPVREQVDRMDTETFFKVLAQALKTNKPAPQDALLVEKMRRVRIVPGQDYTHKSSNRFLRKALVDVPHKALEKIMNHKIHAGKSVNDWLITLKTGRYGTDYLQRAYIAAVGLGTNLPCDALYPITEKDSKGRVLNGKHSYVIHFPKEAVPPVKGFWSVTLYNDEYFFAKNPLKKYSISPRDPLQYNNDGSLDLYIQESSPGINKESNWLPAPLFNFILMLRLYWPEKAVIDGTWQPPAVVRTH